LALIGSAALHTMPSEYDPLRPRQPLSGEASDLDKVQALFAGAASGYVSSPWPWVCWAIVLPAAAMMTTEVATVVGPLAVLLLWSIAILVAGAVEAFSMRRARNTAGRSDITGWVFKGQGNLSLIAIVLTGALAWQRLYDFLPAVWLLLIGHSFFAVGGLASNALKRGGLLYQIGGVVSLLPWFESLDVFAAATALANGTIAASLFLRRRSGAAGSP
jgi:hypothetical protein